MAVMERGKRQTKEGIVVRDALSQKQMKTVTVQVERSIKHPKVKKYVRRFKRLLVHDAKNECRNGDRVRILMTKPISKHKHWKVVNILEKAQ